MQPFDLQARSHHMRRSSPQRSSETNRTSSVSQTSRSRISESSLVLNVGVGSSSISPLVIAQTDDDLTPVAHPHRLRRSVDSNINNTISREAATTGDALEGKEHILGVGCGRKWNSEATEKGCSIVKAKAGGVTKASSSERGCTQIAVETFRSEKSGSSKTSAALCELHAKYEVYDSEEVGHGAYGVVVKGKHKTTGEFVAIKQISKKKVSSRMLDELQGEVETLTLVGNTWTVKLEDVFQDDDYLLIVMDYIPGGNLSDALRKVGKFSELTVRHYASCLLKAVAFIHKRGIVHRDLKPANCLLAEPQRVQGVHPSIGPTTTPPLQSRQSFEGDHEMAADVKIADFGFATMAGEGQCLTGYCGTTNYMAPEIICRNTNYGKEVDMWAMGVMLYVLLCGELPFRGSSGDAQMASVCAGKFNFDGPAWCKVSNSARSLISKMLVVNPSQRITAHQALHHPWVLSEVPDSVREIAYPLGLPRSLSLYFQDKARPLRPRLKGLVKCVMAAHRLLWYGKVKALNTQGLGQIPTCRSFSFLVSHTFEPRSHKLVAGSLCAANPKAVRYLADMVDASTTLEVFDVSNTQLDNVDLVQYLAKVAVGHPSLTTLNLEDNPIPLLAGRTLLRLARTATGLTLIKCRRTTLDSEVIEQIYTDLKANERKRHDLDASARSALHLNSSTCGSLNGSFSSLYTSPIGSPPLLPATAGSFTSNPMTGGSPVRSGLGGVGGATLQQRSLSQVVSGASSVYMLPPALHTGSSEAVLVGEGRASASANSVLRSGISAMIPKINRSSRHETKMASAQINSFVQQTNTRQRKSIHNSVSERFTKRSVGTELIPNDHLLMQRARSTSPMHTERSAQGRNRPTPTSYTPTPTGRRGEGTSGCRNSLPPLHGSPGVSKH